MILHTRSRIRIGLLAALALAAAPLAAQAADVAISALPAASSVGTTDTTVIVQGGVTKKAAISLIMANTAATATALAANPTDCSANNFATAIAANGNLTCGQPSISAGISGLGTGVATALGVNVGSAGAPVLFNGALGTPSSGTATNLTGTASGLTAGNVTTIPTLSGDVSNTGNAITVTKVNGASLPTISAGTLGGVLYWDNVTGAGNINRAAITGLALGNGTSAPSAYGGTSCTNQFPRSLNASGAATCASVATADISDNAITAAKLAAVQTRRVCSMAIGDTAGSAITNTQIGPQKRLCFIPAAATIAEMTVAADAGTPNVIVGRNRAGTVVNVVSAALATAASGGIACSNTGGTTGIDGATTCSSTLQNTGLNAGDYLELVSGTAGGTAKLLTVHVTYTIN